MNTKVDEGKLISGKEALIALCDGLDVEHRMKGASNWGNDPKTIYLNLNNFINGQYEFRLKLNTITINGIEVPAPFEPGKDDAYWVLNTNIPRGYERKKGFVVCLAWRTEEEVKQVVSALRQVFGGSHGN